MGPKEVTERLDRFLVSFKEGSGVPFTVLMGLKRENPDLLRALAFQGVDSQASDVAKDLAEKASALRGVSGGFVVKEGEISLPNCFVEGHPPQKRTIQYGSMPAGDVRRFCAELQRTRLLDSGNTPPDLGPGIEARRTGFVDAGV